MPSDKYLVLALLLAGLTAALVLIWRRRQFLRRAVRTSGTVTEISVKVSESWGGAGQPRQHSTYDYPHVKFPLDDGSVITFRGRVLHKPTYRVGESVTVAYEPGHPSTTAEIEGAPEFRPVTAAVCATVLALVAAIWVLLGEEGRGALAEHPLAMPALGALVLVIALLALLRRIPRRPVRGLLYLLVSAVEIYGFSAFLVQGVAAAGGLISLVGPTTEWPVGAVAHVATDAAGHRVVPVIPGGRVQVYDRAGRFLRGWFVEASGGDFRARPNAEGQIEVYTERGGRRLVYSPEGELLLRTTDDGGAFSRTDPGETESTFPFPWPLWPLARPAAAWATGLVAYVVAGSLAEKKRELAG